MAMGPLGAVTRTAGALFGNAMTFASAGKASAPGQIDVHELKRILDTIDVDGVFDEHAMTFASAGKASAPGQIDVHELKRILDTIDVDGVFDEQQHKRVKVH